MIEEVLNIKNLNNKDFKVEDIISILNEIPYCVWIKNKNEEYTYVNNCFKKLCSFDDLAGENGSFTNHFYVNKEFEYKENLVRKYKIPVVIEYCLAVNGDVKWFESYVFSLNDKEESNCIVGISREIKKYEKSEIEKVKNPLYKEASNQKDTQIAFDIDSLSCEIMNCVNAAGMSIYLYDHSIDGFKIKSKFGMANKLNLNDKYKTEDYENNKKIKTYPIKIGEFNIGLLILYYSNTTFNSSYDYLVKSLCLRLTLIYQNEFLLLNLEKKLKKKNENEENLLATSSNIYGEIKKKNNEYIITNRSNNIFRSNIPIKIRDILIEEDYKKIEYIMNKRKYENSKICNLKGRVINSGEIYRYVEFNLYFISQDKTILIGIDKTKQYMLEEENKKLEQEFLLESKKREFFTNLSHELKTPLNIIITATQLLESRGYNRMQRYDDEGLIKYTKIVKQNSYRLLKLINNLIDVTKIEKGDYELKLGNYNIVKVIEDIVNSLKEYIGTKERKINFSKAEKDILISCDPEKIERIILNLVSNAIKYTEQDGIIEVEIKSNNGIVFVHVRNDGLPIDKNDAENIFNRFERTDNKLTRINEGCGIGLSLVKSLVEMHSGKIYVNTKVEKGTEFIFELPINTIKGTENKNIENKIVSDKIEKCSIEFADIYSI